MVKYMKKINIIIISIILLSFILGIYLYPSLPSEMASHWNSQGEVNGYMSKFWGLFLMPIVIVALFLIFLIIPKIDPLKKNIEKFRKYFDGFILLMVIFMVYIHILTLLWNFNYRFNMTTMIIPAIAVLFYFIGIMLKEVKRNWFIGIRTPWTLSSDVIWEKTHQLGSKLFKLSAVLMLMGLFFDQYLVWFVLVPTLGTALFLIVYSYVEYKKRK